MASYNLNEVLKKKAATTQDQQPEEMHLDDVSRVKVLSPGRQVFKRFIRNRLAVFGTILLALMFIFSFIGPLFYPYGQKQIFYKYDSMNVNYALAKENTAFTGYTYDASVKLHRNAKSVMNTRIKEMKADGQDQLLFMGDDGLFYQVERLGDHVYTLGQRTAEEAASFGSTETHIGTLDAIAKKIKYKGDALDDGFPAAAAKACKGKDGSFTYNGAEYTYARGKGKSYEIYGMADGFVYAGAQLGEAFEAAAEAAAPGVPFEVEDKAYVALQNGESTTVYQVSDSKLAQVYTNFALDTFQTGQSISDSFRCEALLAAYGSRSFEANGAAYTVAEDGDALVIRDAAGSDYAEFTTFVIRRYNGEDTMEYRLKQAVGEAIEQMKAAGQYNTTLTFELPQQNAAGEYDYDENGQLKYNETLMKITQKDTGEYVINCDQIIYMIDMYAAPSGTHLLGTDGDGFDVLARIMYGGRISLMVGFVVVFLEIVLGVIMGGLAGYYGGWVDNLIMRLVDIFYCLPSMPIMIILGAVMDALRMNTYVRLMIMMAALGIMGWAGVARMVRGQILSLREQEFMVATEATGVRVKDRIFRHLVPNVMPQLIVIATMGIGSVILTESTLSFLGLGVKHPLATWGTIINSVSSASAMAHYAFIWIPVGLLICLTVIAFNFVGDGLRDAYDPKSKR